MKKLLLTLVVVLMGAMTVGAMVLPEPGVYKIRNVYSGTYVMLQHSMLADITATQEGASHIYTWYVNKPNGEGLVTNLSGDGGDMMETLDMIKGLIEELLEYKEMPTWFLDEMFQLHLVSTGDADGSVFLCVDVPEIEDWETIKAAILEAAGGQTAVTYYITHMVPGNRHYMGIDYDGSFGYRLQAGTEEGTDIKWIMEPQDVDADGYAYVRQAADAATPYLALNERYNAVLSMTADARCTNPGAVFRYTRADVLATQLRTQGVDFAPVGNAVKQVVASAMGEAMNADDCRLTMNQTYTSADKFTYNARYLRLSIPATTDEEAWENAKPAVLQAVADVLGSESGIYQALVAAQDQLVPNKSIFFVPANGGVGVMGEAEALAAGDDAKWIMEDIDSEEVCFGANAAVARDGKYYATLYTDFPYQIVSEDVKPLIVTGLTELGEAGYEQLQELGTSLVPARTPVVLECGSQLLADNLLTPVMENGQNGAPKRAESTSNILQGTFFNNDVAVNENTRVLDATGFVPTTDAYVIGNTAWLEAIPETSTSITDVTIHQVEGDGAYYDLTGRRVDNPSQGIYIRNHQKVLVK